MGALDLTGQQLHHQQVSGSVNREMFVAFIDGLLPLVSKATPTFIILDNARIHHGLDTAITLRWMTEHNTFLCYLPPYSPELNMIEILWKQAKYHWRAFVTWSKDSFRENVKDLLDGYGTKFRNYSG